ncbi:surface protein [Ruminococcaceae bacterium FB2012]|nr:surface protein [Ruminococcaceae bacterium FB2012]
MAGAVPADIARFDPFEAVPVSAEPEEHTAPYVVTEGSDVVLHLAGSEWTKDDVENLLDGSQYSKPDITKIIADGGTVLPANCSQLFYGLGSKFCNVKSIDLSNADASGVTDMSYMFAYCEKMTELILGDDFDTSSVTDMNSMFFSCRSLSALELGNSFDTSKATNIGFMFGYCSSLTALDLRDKFDTSKAEYVAHMFTSCDSLSRITLNNKFSTGITDGMYLPNGNGWYKGTEKISGSGNNAVIAASNFDAKGTLITKGIVNEFQFTNLTLKDDLGLNFYVSNVTDDSMGSLSVRFTGKCAENGTVIPLTKKVIDGKNYYCAAAKETAMANALYEYYKAAREYIITSDLSIIDHDITLQDGEVLTGKSYNSKKICIAEGATVTLKDVYLRPDGTYAGIICDNNCTIILEGKNTLVGGGYDDSDYTYKDYPGIYIAPNKTPTTDGTGSLSVDHNNIIGSGAGIGGGTRMNCGNIVINGGTINVVGGAGAPGIGSGDYATGGNIIINGGTVNAKGGMFAPGIGSGHEESSCGNITITNGVTKVTATAGEFSPNSIDAGKNGTCGTVTIGGTTGPISESPYTYEPEH